jgi:phosphoglycerol geranylgeranyltransferase
LDNVTKALQDSVEIPIILFPGNHGGVTKYADAIWFMSLLNSSDPYFLVGAQILGAPVIKKMGLEPLSMGYIIVGEGGTVSLVGKATPIPLNRSDLAVAHALAAQYFGMHFVYLEAGSGVDNPVSSDIVTAVKDALDIPIIVGGGIRTGEQAKEIVNAGASIIVTGNVLEENNSKNKMQELISNVKTK